MPDIHFKAEWTGVQSCNPLERDTSCLLSIWIDGHQPFTKCIDIWSRTVQDSVLVSSYPIAVWLVTSWRSLNYVPKPVRASAEKMLQWQASHELSGAEMGDTLTEYLKHCNDGYALEEAAQHFGVSPLTVETVLVNNGVLPAKQMF